MDWLSIGIHSLGMMASGNDWKEDALDLVAKMPRLLGLIFRYREGRGENIPEDDLSLNLVERFTNTLDLENVDRDAMNKILSTYLVLHMDHGGGNLSTFTGKAVASGHATVYSSMAGAMNALSGPLHGRANQSCFEFVKKIGTFDPDEVEDFVRGELAAKRPVFGFGHAVLRAEDPRATVQFALGEKLCPDDEYFKTIRTLREVAPRVLSENPKISNPNANVDIASGTLLNYVGLTKPEYYTTFFGWARVAGIGAQIIDERMVMRDGKGIPIYRPKYIAEEQSLRHLD
jgi:citrate synthase